MNVLNAAWKSAGAPDRDSAHVGNVGRCARCATDGDLTPVREVLSKVFTGFEGWFHPGGRGLCAACSWGYSNKALRAVPHLISRDPASMRELTRAAVSELLAEGALEAGSAVVVPLRPGRKHILPSAAWGRVSVDDAHLPWTDRDAQLLGLVVRLRRLGFGSRMITEPAPPYQVLSQLDTSVWALVLYAWEQLSPWRAPANPWLALALHLTTSTSISKEP